jgi:uncharacterized protein
MAFNILALDGGGIRGVISARILQDIEEYVQENFHQSLNEYFDLITGTSTGSIIAAGLASGKLKAKANSDKEKCLLTIYEKQGKEIFPYTKYSLGRLCHILKYKFSLLADIFKEIFGNNSKNESQSKCERIWQNFLGIVLKIPPKYSHDGLIKLLKEHLGDNLTLEDTWLQYEYLGVKKAELLILAYDTQYRNTTNFAKYPEERWVNSQKLWEICVCSSSAPTFFPPYKLLHREDRSEWIFPHVDGGVSANNPSLAAIAYAMDKKNQKLEDISILSIGTGRTTEPFLYEQVKSWGLLNWAKQIPNVFMGGQHGINVSLCRQLMGSDPKKYLRLNFDLNETKDDKNKETDDYSPPRILPKSEQKNRFIGKGKRVNEAMDDASEENIKDLIAATEGYLKSESGDNSKDNKPVPVKQSIKEFLDANQKSVNDRKIMSNPILRRGSKGESVKKLQKFLNRIPNRSGADSLTIDGDFGDNTEKALKLFQSSNGLAANGVVGEETWAAALSLLYSKNQPPPMV